MKQAADKPGVIQPAVSCSLRLSLSAAATAAAGESAAEVG